jgi:excinuclease ABC subunit C
MNLMPQENELVPQSVRDGNARIRSYLKSLDGSPGVYRMLDASDRVLYVGKAKNLKNRVSSYTRSVGHSARITRMISETLSMMFLTTETEIEALLLEQNLIKNLKPKYNVLFRDDKSFASIVVDKKHKFAQIRKHRGAKKEKGSYYGPFANAGAVERTLNQIQKVFLLRNCSDATFESRSRPCLMHQIKRCCAPCVGKIDELEYKNLVFNAEQFLLGKSSNMNTRLVNEMREASERQEFEKAAGLRDRIRALTEVQTQQGFNPKNISEADIIGLHQEYGQACIQVFFIRAYQNWGNRDYFPNIGFGADASEIMQTFLGQFYFNKTPPKTLYLSTDIPDPILISEMLSEKAGYKVNLIVPRRGAKVEIVRAAKRNAKESLARRLSDSSTQKKLLQGLAEVFKLESAPERIEVFDNSHFQGASAVGAMIVAGPDGYIKNHYRKFNIKGQNANFGDDFAMMEEVLTRRFERHIMENLNGLETNIPDLLIIDGGLGHISVVSRVMKSLGLERIPVFGVSKGIDRNAGKEEFHNAVLGTFVLKRNDPVLYFVQRLRDEAHRFAIGTHRIKRKQDLMKSPLDEISGIGAKRKKNLLEHFGSAKAVGRASKADIKSVEGISDQMAEIVFEFFHDGK